METILHPTEAGCHSHGMDGDPIWAIYIEDKTHIYIYVMPQVFIFYVCGPPC